MNRDSGNRPSFWVSLPGTITALTGLVVGIATLLGILYETGIFGKGEPEGTVTANNELPPTPIPAAMHAPTPTDTPAPTPTRVPPTPIPTEDPESIVRDFVIDLWARAINAEICAYSNIDCTCAEEVFSGEALSAIETQIDDLVADGLVWEQEFVDGRVVDIRPISSSEVEVDTCEIWAGEFYGLYDGSHYHSVPPTLYLRMITMEDLGGTWFITQDYLYKSSDSCSGILQ
jgi:hypothetical protein